MKKPFLVCVFAIILLPACAWLRGDSSVDDRFTAEDLEDFVTQLPGAARADK